MRELHPSIESIRNPESYLAKLWRSYRFMGESPPDGSPAAERLYNTCRQYVELTMGKKGYLDSVKKELHDQIAVMTIGQSRHSLAPAQAEAVANFASEYVQGFKFDEAEKYQEPVEEQL